MEDSPQSEGIILRETVIVVHGTFEGPIPGVTKWWQPGGYFCKSLDAELEAQGSPARCWAHCENGRHPVFGWDGRNNWRSRYEASIRLDEHLKTLLREGWRCHVVAHSHGGNVVIRALHPEIVRYLGSRLNNPADWGASIADYRLDDLWYTNNGLGEIVCLGTPFIDMPQFDQTRIGETGREERRSAAVTVAASLAAAAISILLWTNRLDSDDIYKWFSITVSGLLLALAAWAVFQSAMISLVPLVVSSRRRDLSTLLADLQRQESQPNLITYWTHLLVQTSPHDEARILLKTFQPPRLSFRTPIVRRAWADIGTRFREALRERVGILSMIILRREDEFADRVREDPFRVRRGMRAAIIQIIWAIVIILVASIYGVTSWISARHRVDILFLMTALIGAVMVVHPAGRSGIKGVLGSLFWPIRRLASAIVLQVVAVPVGYGAARRAVYGLEDFPHDPDVIVHETPFWHSSDFFIHENLDSTVASLAQGRRQAWLDSLLTRIPEVAGDQEIVAEVFREIVGDPSLVHSAYHLSPENAARIARFIAFRQ